MEIAAVNDPPIALLVPRKQVLPFEERFLTNSKVADLFELCSILEAKALLPFLVAQWLIFLQHTNK